MHGMRVVDSGPLSTIQDDGRFGFQHLGFSPTGAVDMRSLYLANHLVGNRPGTPAIEVTLGGLKLCPTDDITFAVVGVGGNVVVGGRPRPCNQTLYAQANEEIRIVRLKGARAYLAVAGGVAVKKVLGSAATDLVAGIGGFEGRRLQPGDMVEIGMFESRRVSRAVRESFLPQMQAVRIVEMSSGPQRSLFTDDALFRLTTSEYTVSAHSDRVGLRLLGPSVSPRQGNILSEGQPAGAVQIPPSGEPIVLLAGRLTIGGYPKVGVVSRRDLADLAQLLPGSRIRFRWRPLEAVVEETRNWLLCLRDSDCCTRVVVEDSD